MTANGDFQVNADFPTNTCTLHAPGSTNEMNKQETSYKAVCSTKRDGGCLSFESPEADQAEGHKRFPNLAIDKCGSPS